MRELVERLRLRNTMKALLLLLCMSVGLQAYEYRGMVVGVSDGDTIKVLDENKVQHKIRLYGIDAPEKKQAFGTKSKEALSNRLSDAKNQVVVTVVNKDRYGREVAKVMPCYWHPQAMDCIATSYVNEDQVLYGWAWAYVSYLKKKDKERYVNMERIAQSQKAGLWADPHPTPPWKFRRMKKK
jgi:endonuclease YncB( thermonuclease family)